MQIEKSQQGENNKPKLLYLIIYNENTPYENEMKKILEKYVHKFPHIQTYFISLKKLNKPYEICNNVIYFDGNETFIPGIFDKTIKAMKFFTAKNDYDYIIRGNISTVINLDGLTNLLINNKYTNIYASGYMIPFQCDCDLKDKMPLRYSLVLNKVQYASGTNIILDKFALSYLLHVVDKTIPHKMDLELDNLWDDEKIGYIMNLDNNNIKIVDFPGFVSNVNNSTNFDDIIFYRNRTHDRYADVQTMSKFIDYIN